ncbi:hypothetical protein PFISCL1PPCAC_26392 [Pristionchus fissidentatus]|uniref:Uncharacterized protein n=1 Tax=Pristionchus fissidentatus TaxID=1538716 RepID=A0AAV5WWQ9_9BILA|nr:hypothetical protein PFISCL1PPCAC_26392 [Pristionchus fissidentatus]
MERGRLSEILIDVMGKDDVGREGQRQLSAANRIDLRLRALLSAAEGGDALGRVCLILEAGESLCVSEGAFVAELADEQGQSGATVTGGMGPVYGEIRTTVEREGGRGEYGRRQEKASSHEHHHHRSHLGMRWRTGDLSRTL